MKVMGDNRQNKDYDPNIHPRQNRSLQLTDRGPDHAARPTSAEASFADSAGPGPSARAPSDPASLGRGVSTRPGRRCCPRCRHRGRDARQNLAASARDQHRHADRWRAERAAVDVRSGVADR